MTAPTPDSSHRSLRTIVVGLVWNRRAELLLCRMSPELNQDTVDTLKRLGPWPSS